MVKHYKLIRDKIPKIIKSAGKKYQLETIKDQKKYQQALKLKLIEEAKEVINSQTKEDLVEEIADIYEVIEALINAHDLDKENIKKIKQNKSVKKGKFERKLKLISVEENIFSVENLPQDEKLLLENLQEYLSQINNKQANLIDNNIRDLQVIVKQIQREKPKLFHLKIPKDWGGIGISKQGFYLWQTIIAQHSGALAFLQTQHQSAVSMIAQSENNIIQRKYLPAIINNHQLYGVGFSHLRREGKPSLTAIKLKGGYQLTGNIPWITGYGFFSHVIVGAILPTGEEFYGITTLDNETKNKGEMQLSKPLNLFAFNSTNTVTAELENWFIPDEDIVMIKPKLAIHQRDKNNILHHSFFALGCCQKALQICQENQQKLNLETVNQGINKLVAEWENLWQKIFTAVTDSDQSFDYKLQLRVQAINLLYRCVESAVITSKGSANGVNHPASRLYREALVYGVSGQTQPLLAEYFNFS